MLVSRAVRDHLETLRAIAVAFGAFLITTMAGAVFATAAQTCLEPRDGLGAKRVIGGDPANPRHWPGYAQLRWFDPQTGDAMYLCGGTVVDPQTVLTAAHCFRTTRQVDGKWIDAVSGKVLQVVLGVVDLGTVEEDDQIFDVSAVEKHEHYDEMRYENDIALVRLAKPWNGAQMRLALTETAEPTARSLVFVAGFGNTKGDRQGPDGRWFRARNGRSFYSGAPRLLEASLPLVSPEICAGRYRNALTRREQICAGFDAGGKDSCQGDSGGPLVAYDMEGCPYQIGIVSWGEGCAERENYGVYTRVSAYTDWLTKNVSSVRQSLPIMPRPTNAKIEVPSGGVALSKAESFEASVKPFAREVQLRIVEGTRVRLNRQITVELTSPIAGQAILFDIGSLGEIAPLLPLRRAQIIAVEPGKPQVLTGRGGFREIVALPPKGVGRLVALVAPKEIDLTGLLADRPEFRDGRTNGYLADIIAEVRATREEDDDVATPLTNPIPRWGYALLAYEIVD